MSVAFHRSLMVFALAFGLLAPFLATTNTAFACSCEPPNLERQFAAASVAFAGEVESVRSTDDGAAVRVEFEADRFWKGEPSEHIVVYTAPNSAACGVNFEQGDDYFVLAYGAERLETNLCQFNVNLDDGSDADIEAIESFGEGQEPDDDDPPSQGGNGDNGDDEPSNGDGDHEGGSDSEVDADPMNVAAVAVAGLVAAGAVVFVARRT